MLHHRNTLLPFPIWKNILLWAPISPILSLLHQITLIPAVPLRLPFSFLRCPEPDCKFTYIKSVVPIPFLVAVSVVILVGQTELINGVPFSFRQPLLIVLVPIRIRDRMRTVLLSNSSMSLGFLLSIAGHSSFVTPKTDDVCFEVQGIHFKCVVPISFLLHPSYFCCTRNAGAAQWAYLLESKLFSCRTQVASCFSYSRLLDTAVLTAL